MIAIGRMLISNDSISTAEIDSRYYANGSATWLVVKLKDGRVIREEHGYGFDAFAKLDEIQKAIK